MEVATPFPFKLPSGLALPVTFKPSFLSPASFSFPSALSSPDSLVFTSVPSSPNRTPSPSHTSRTPSTSHTSQTDQIGALFLSLGAGLPLGLQLLLELLNPALELLNDPLETGHQRLLLLQFGCGGGEGSGQVRGRGGERG